jgi:hypothetical protein
VQLKRYLLSLSHINNHISIVGSPNKWNNGILNPNWLREFHWLSHDDNGIFELRRIGVPATTLRRAGYEYKELLDSGYTENELLMAGYTNR